MSDFELPSQFETICPNCDDTPFTVNDLVWRIVFPDDELKIIEVLYGRLNRARCPACQKFTSLTIPVIVQNSRDDRAIIQRANLDEQELVATFTKAELLGEELQEILEKITFCNGYDELRIAILPWVFEELREVSTLVLTGDIVRLDSEVRAQELTRFRLRILRLVADEVLDIYIKMPKDKMQGIRQHLSIDDDDEAMRVHWRRQVAGTLYRVLQDEWKAALARESLRDLYSRVRERLPGEILDELVLDACLEDCVSLREASNSLESFYSAYRVHYLNAVVHALLQRENPRGKDWAEFLDRAWYLVPQGVFWDHFLPSLEDAPSIVRFEDLWDVCAPRLILKDAEESEARILQLTDIMQRLGFEDRVLAMLQRGPIVFNVPGADPQGLDRLGKVYLEILKEKYPLPLPAEESLGFGVTVGRLVGQLLTNGLNKQATELAFATLQYALDAKDYVAAYSVGINSARELSLAEQWLLATEVLAPLVERIKLDEVTKQLGTVDLKLVADFWIECGNTLRYRQNYADALETYELARSLSDLCNEETSAYIKDVIAQNEGLVYRAMRSYKKAYERLKAYVDRRPTDTAGLHSLAILYIETNDLGKALALMERAITASDPVTNQRNHARLLMTRGFCAARKGDTELALESFGNAIQLSPSAEAFVTRLSAAVGFYIEPGTTHPIIQQARERLEAVVTGQITHDSSGVNGSLLVTCLAALGMMLLRGESEAELQWYCNKHLDPYLQDKKACSIPWEVYATRGYIALQLDGAKAAWKWLTGAMQRIDERQPIGLDAEFSMGWLGDKDKLQLALAEAAIQMSNDGHLPETELIPVFDFVNGWSLAAMSGHDSFYAVAKQTFVALENTAELLGTPVCVVALLESSDSVQMFISRSGEEELKPVEGAYFSTAYVRKVNFDFADAMSYANPANLDNLDIELEGWSKFAHDFGAWIAPHLEPGCHVSILPGRSAAGLPLHLCPLGPDRGTLIEEHPVLYSANFSSLFSGETERSADRARSRLIVAVPKAKDSEEFADQLKNAAKDITTSWQGETRLLVGTDSTREAIQVGLSNSEEAFFLCHGVDGGRLAGFALCISDGNFLPPSRLSIDDVPELKPFTLDWNDLSDLERAPSLVVSIACSTGRTVVVRGGTRLGIEHTIFARGTRCLISPQWDVDQEAALAWVAAFEEARASGQALSPVEVCRLAALAVKRKFNHPYFWAPFIAKGSFLTKEISS